MLGSAMTASPSLENLRFAVRRACLAIALVIMPVSALSAAGPVLWSLKKPAASDPLAGWGIPVPERTDRDALPMLPDPMDGSEVRSTDPLRQDFSVAPSVDNILNRRHDLSDDQAGDFGNSGGYLRSVGRTFGLALKKALY